MLCVQCCPSLVSMVSGLWSITKYVCIDWDLDLTTVNPSHQSIITYTAYNWLRYNLPVLGTRFQYSKNYSHIDIEIGSIDKMMKIFFWIRKIHQLPSPGSPILSVPKCRQTVCTTLLTPEKNDLPQPWSWSILNLFINYPLEPAFYWLTLNLLNIHFPNVQSLMVTNVRQWWLWWFIFARELSPM